MKELEGVALQFRKELCEPRRVQIGADGAHAEEVMLPAGEGFEFAVGGTTCYVALHDMLLKDHEIVVGGATPIRKTDLRRTLTFLPAGVATRGWCDPIAAPQSFTAVYFDAEFLPEELRAGAWWEEPEVYFRSTEVEAALLRLKRALSRNEPFLPLMGETLCQLTVVELASRADRAGASERTTRGLSRLQLRRVDELIETDFSADLSLEDLAAATGLSKYHFLRAYKAATGVTPYRALLDRRVQRAKDLLSAGSQVTLVAETLGFSSVAEFSRAFRRRTGQTPTAFRDAL